MATTLRHWLADRRAWVAIAAGIVALVLTVPPMVRADDTAATERATSVEVHCTPSEVAAGGTAECTVTIADESDPESERTEPAGQASLASDIDGDLGACTLIPADDRTAACSIELTAASAGEHLLTATFEPETDGEPAFASSTSVTVLDSLEGGIVIEQVTFGGAAALDYTLDGPAGSIPFTLKTSESGVDGIDRETFSDLEPGAYTVSVEEHEGWTLAGVVCAIDPAESESTTSSDTGAGTITIDLAAEETVTCRVEFAAAGSLTIQQDGAPSTTYGFSTTNLPGDGTFQIDTDESGRGQITFDDLAARTTYTMAVDGPESQEVTAIECRDDAGSDFEIGSTDLFEPGDTSVAVSLAAGAAVTCRVTTSGAESSAGNITIGIDAGGEDGVFHFVAIGLTSQDVSIDTAVAPSHTFDKAGAGPYSIALLPDEDWEPVGAACDVDGSGSAAVNGMAVDLALEAGDAAVCTFTVTPAEESGAPGDGEHGDTVVGCGAPAAPALSAAYLREQGLKPGGPGQPNVQAAVAAELRERTSLRGIEPCDDGYREAVEQFVNELIAEHDIEQQQRSRPGRADEAGASDRPTHAGPPEHAQEARERRGPPEHAGPPEGRRGPPGERGHPSRGRGANR